MAVSNILDVSRLDDGWILAPERYDPRRSYGDHIGPRLSDIANVLREQVSARKVDNDRRFLVLDTGDASNGIIRTQKTHCSGLAIGSTKKRIRVGQVIISRLRPYLRQVAWVDAGLAAAGTAGIELVCSTEFFVLESKNERSIAFLVPFLLCERIQEILAASQEGGHHPRFNERTLTTLPIPAPFLERREELSVQVEHAVSRARRSFRELESYIERVSRLVTSDRDRL